MGFSGQLTEIDLAGVLQNLEQSGATGTLRVEGPRGARDLYLQSGRIAACLPGPDWARWLGPVLIPKTKLNVERWDKVLEAWEREGGDLTELIARRRAAPKAEVEEALAFLQREAITDLLAEARGRFDFQPGERDPERFPGPFAEVDLRLPAQSLLMEAARRSDEMSQLAADLGSPKAVYVPAPNLAPPDPESDEGVLTALMDGTRDVEALCRDSGLGRHRASVAIATLLSGARLVPMGAGEHVELGDTRSRQARPADAAFHYRRALELRSTDRRTRGKLAEALIAAGELEDGVTQLKLLATEQRGGGDAFGAIATTERILELGPDDIDARGRLFELLSAAPEDSEERRRAPAAGVALARSLSERGLHDKARGRLAEVLELGPKDPDAVREDIAQTYLNQGDKAGAVSTLRSAAELAEEAGRGRSALRLLHAALELDPDDADAARLRDDILSGRREARRQLWQQLRRCFVYALLIAGLCAWLAYESAAAVLLVEVEREVFGDLDRGDRDTAVVRLRGFAEAHPWSLSGSRAAGHAAAIDGLNYGGR